MIESPVPRTSDPTNVHRSPHREFQAIVGEIKGAVAAQHAVKVSHSIVKYA